MCPSPKHLYVSDPFHPGGRLADELRAEQEHAQTQEKMRKALEVQVKDLQVRCRMSHQATLYATMVKTCGT